MYRRCVILVACLFLLPLLSGLTGCVYYNTFYNAKKEFKQAEKQRKQTGSGSQAGYKTAIDKSLKVLEDHPNSKYYDDALFVLAVSYYHTGQHAKSERRLRELLANYPDSKFTKEATLYLARAKLKINERDAATDLFEEIFQGKFDKQYKAEAAMELGAHYLDTKEFDLALNYFKAVRDSLGDDRQKLQTQRYIADANFGAFKFADALSAYLQILGMKPDKNERYHALYRAALCSYRLQRITTGLDYLQQLIKDQLYFDSLGVLNLTVAQGYDYAGELDQAIGAYSDVATNTKNAPWISEAYYQLGLIYQYDYDDLKQAKEYYDKSFNAYTGSPSGQDAMQRSADIAKLQLYTKREQKDVDSLPALKDTTLTEEKRQDIRQRQIDDDANTVYQLGELYWFKLNKPDSAILEMEHLVERFPTSKHAPRAMLALSAMRRDFLADTAGADSILREAVQRYPQSDDLPEILAQLHMKGTEADTGYAAYYFHKAENFYVDENNLDSAIYYYQYVEDHFPKSPYALQCKFNIIWLNEMYRSPGDSSIIFAYQELIDSFPNSPQAAEATKRLTYRPRAPQQRTDEDDQRPKERADSADAKPGTPQEATPVSEDTTAHFGNPLERAYIGPKGERLILLEAQPTEVRVEFEFPAEANAVEGTAWELYYQILLDFSGKVIDYVLKTPGPHEEINRRAGLTVQSMSFDPLEVNRQLTQKAESLTLPEDQEDKRGRWYVYKFLVQKPDYLR